jgi:Flp pilus assembly protein TadG
MMRALASRLMFPGLRQQIARLRFAADTRGVSAVEFAMILPVMMVLFLGGVEISKAISINRKVTLAARSLADLVSQAPKVTSGDIANVLTAGEAVSWPYNDANLKLRVSQIKIDANKVAKIDWSRARNHTAHAPDLVMTIPAALAIPDSSIILGEVEYDFNPSVGVVIIGALKMQDKIYMQPRLTASVTCDNC